MRVGFIGLGRMGTPMAANLVAAGFDVGVWNRSPEKARAFAAEHGATVHATPAELAAASDVVVTMVADGTALEDIYRRADGVLAGLGPGKIAVDMSTVGPATIGRLAPDVEAAGAALVDAPVSGSTEAAATRRLMIMVGGDPDAVERVRPVLEAMGSPVTHVGQSGAGATMKLAVNSMIYAINEAVSEAMVLAENAGIDRSVALDTFVSSAASSPMLTYRRGIYEQPGSAPVTFTVAGAAKDLNLILELAEATGTPMPAAETALRVMRETSAAGMGDEDMGMTAEYLRRRPTSETAEKHVRIRPSRGGILVLTDKIKQLIDQGTVGMMATVLPSGLIQNQPVWVDRDGDYLLVNTEVERRKFKNLEANPSVTVTIMEPGNPWSWTEVRGRMVEAIHGREARDHIDTLAQRYLGKDEYPNPIGSPRVIVKIEPVQVFEFPPGR